MRSRQASRCMPVPMRHGQLAEEVLALHRAGMPRVQALASWTAREWLGWSGLGHGAVADFVRHDTDPREAQISGHWGIRAGSSCVARFSPESWGRRNPRLAGRASLLIRCGPSCPVRIPDSADRRMPFVIIWAGTGHSAGATGACRRRGKQWVNRPTSRLAANCTSSRSRTCPRALLRERIPEPGELSGHRG